MSCKMVPKKRLNQKKRTKERKKEKTQSRWKLKFQILKSQEYFKLHAKRSFALDQPSRNDPIHFNRTK